MSCRRYTSRTIFCTFPLRVVRTNVLLEMFDSYSPSAADLLSVAIVEVRLVSLLTFVRSSFRNAVAQKKIIDSREGGEECLIVIGNCPATSERATKLQRSQAVKPTSILRRTSPSLGSNKTEPNRDREMIGCFSRENCLRHHPGRRDKAGPPVGRGRERKKRLDPAKKEQPKENSTITGPRQGRLAA